MAKGGKKGKGGKGGKKGASASHAGATLTKISHTSNLPSWKPDPVSHRPAPSLLPHRPAPMVMMPDFSRLPVQVVRAALASDLDTVRHWIMRGYGAIDALWDRPDGTARGFTLLMLASVRGLAPVVEVLLHHCASFDLRNSAGATALILAAAHDRHPTGADGARSRVAQRPRLHC